MRDLGATKGVKLEEPNAIAVSAAAGTVYVADAVKGTIDQFSDAGVLEAKLKGSGSPLGSFAGGEEAEGNVTAVAVDEANGDLLVSEEERDVVSELNGAGEWVGWVTGTLMGPFGEVDGVAVGASGDLYVADSAEDVVDVFGPPVVVPDVSTKPASKVTGTTATLKGTVNGDGEPASYHFQLGESEAYSGLDTPVHETAGGGEEKVQAAVSGLKPDTRYFVRRDAENQNGTSCGVGCWFTTEGGEGAGQPGLALLPAALRTGVDLEGESATGVESGEATLHAVMTRRPRHDLRVPVRDRQLQGQPGLLHGAPVHPGRSRLRRDGRAGERTAAGAEAGYHLLLPGARNERSRRERRLRTRFHNQCPRSPVRAAGWSGVGDGHPA